MGKKFMEKKNKFQVSILLLPLLASCSLDIKKIEAKAALMNHYEMVALKLARENRELNAEVKRLEFEIEKLRQETKYGFKSKEAAPEFAHHEKAHESHAEHASEEPTGHGRSIASVAPATTHESAPSDLVEFKTYKWHADDLLKIADKEFKEKNYEKAAQFYTSLVNNYPTYKSINDEFYFKAGIASFESGIHHDWTLSHLESLMSKFPTSQYFRSAKLWVGLTHLKQGDKKKFFATVEEFRKKYRNTSEWKILSSYYEKIEEKTNE